ncbi:insecticidal delta-endotoxin Cry8Ea1 family protein [Bacillus wiedmannii]|nr:insecticidal delta-endotoxin Cry8Ea1 family protein [Bacillus wiedmannii]
MSTQNAYVEQQSVVGSAITTSFQVIRELYRSNKDILSTAGGIIQSIFGFLWKKEHTQTQWEEFMKSVELMIDEKIDTAVMAAAISRVAGLESILAVHQDYLDDLAADPSNSNLQGLVSDHVVNVQDFFVYTMPQLSQSPYQVQQLIAYAEAANLHLAFLRDVVMFGSQWGMQPATIDTYYNYLKNNIQVYTDHCVNTYNTGLEKTKNLMGSINPKDYNKYPYLNPHANASTNNYKKVLQWNVWNDFRRNMTIMVLDLVVVFPTYDPKVYTNLEGTEIELSREVYSTSYNRYGDSTHGGDWKGWEILETSVVRPPHLVSFLSNLAFYMANYANAPTNTGLDQYDGVINTLRNIDSTSTWEDGFAPITKKEYTTVKDIPGDFIKEININSGVDPCHLNFITNSSGTHSVGTCYRSSIQGPIYNLSATIPYHRLSYVNGMDDNFSESFSGWGISAWGFGWLHESLKTSNIINATRSSFIPAVKSYGLWGEATVIKGPGSTGGDLVRLPAAPGVIQVRLPVTRQAVKQYKIRIRYAAQENGELFVGKWANRWWETVNLSLTKTTSSNTPSYSEFKLIDAFHMTANESAFQIELRNNSGGPILIDRIEFIPIQGTLEEYEATQN